MWTQWLRDTSQFKEQVPNGSLALYFKMSVLVLFLSVKYFKCTRQNSSWRKWSVDALRNLAYVIGAQYVGKWLCFRHQVQLINYTI